MGSSPDKSVPRKTRNELFMSDEVKQSSPRLRESKETRSKRQKKAKKQFPKKQELLSRLNETFAAMLDASCYGKQRPTKAVVKPPLVENSSFVKFTRKNFAAPYNRYQVVIYDCFEGFHLRNRDHDRLYCSNGSWLGDPPECVKKRVKYLPNTKPPPHAPHAWTLRYHQPTHVILTSATEQP
ncbi:hypothetical protein QAD02_004118 [Eretmocerus hayati]|uniref:Uncharacterized protein n=1 Tax=Eretmocerus hayati TaxID=131215 RepID=A0ACC2NPW4_9HYME|nr:hypothetical protein QAD02_004118 [Eretmocerus hayati]